MELADEEREFNDREREMLDAVKDVPSLPKQPTLNRDEALAKTSKGRKNKLRAAAEPFTAVIPAATSRRAEPVLPPVTPTTSEIFRDLVVVQKLKGKALYKKASDVVDDRGRLSKAEAAWLTETDDDGAYLIPEEFWKGISQRPNGREKHDTSQ